jgi:tetratricopeptide (TPR) repeat protein
LAEPALSVSRKPGETLRAARLRAQHLEAQHAAARSAIDRGDYPEAERLLAAILSDEPQFLDSAALLERAKEAQRQVQRQSAAQAVAQAVAEAKRLEAAGDLKGAVDAYLRVQALDPSVAGVAASLTGLREKMRAAGEDAFGRAKQYDALGRVPEALALYQRAVQMLPDEHPNKALAQSRVTALKAAIR